MRQPLDKIESDLANNRDAGDDLGDAVRCSDQGKEIAEGQKPQGKQDKPNDRTIGRPQPQHTIYQEGGTPPGEAIAFIQDARSSNSRSACKSRKRRSARSNPYLSIADGLRNNGSEDVAADFNHGPIDGAGDCRPKSLGSICVYHATTVVAHFESSQR